MYPKELLDREPEYDTAEWHEWKEECRAVVEERSSGKAWTTREVEAEFEIEGFLAPICYGKRRSDGKRIYLDFTHSPRFYFNLTVKE